jgi:hypothetical protein
MNHGETPNNFGKFLYAFQDTEVCRFQGAMGPNACPGMDILYAIMVT